MDDELLINISNINILFSKEFVRVIDPLVRQEQKPTTVDK